MRSIHERRNKFRSGSTTVETLLVMVMVTMLFWAFILIFEMCMTTIITNHSAMLMGRSHIVGFEREISQRARNVGMIPISGSVMRPAGLAGANNVVIGSQEEYLIEQYVQERYSNRAEMLHYRFWADEYASSGVTSNPGILSSSLPSDIADSQERVEDFSVTLTVRNYGGYKATRSLSGDLTSLQPKSTDPGEYHRFNNIPMFWKYYGWTKGTSDKQLKIDMTGSVKLLNHAAYYLK